MCATRTPDSEAPVPTFRIAAQQLEKLPPCQARCPNSGDIRGWIGVIAQHEKNGLTVEQAYDEAWLRLAERNPFPATIGRICPHPCEDLCTRVDKDGAVSINAIERFLGDWAIERSLTLPVMPEQSWPESIGVVGSGPASLSFAYQMARRGYRVEVYEQHDVPGGMLRHAIPDYRLPREILDAEIERLLDLDISMAMNVDVGTTVTLDELRNRHALMFLGLGAQQARRLGIPGEDGPGVVSGIDYLQERKTRPVSLAGRRVLVIGGGNTAIDAARSARREGASVTLVYRRSESEMPAAAHEIEDARKEGIEFRFLAAPTRIVRDGQTIRQVEIQAMRLAEPDADGRRRPEPIPAAFERLQADTVIAAVSQAPGWRSAGAALKSGSWLCAGDDGRLDEHLFAGGDDLGPGIASRAIGQGRRAAESAHAELRGQPRPNLQPASPLISDGSVRTDYYAERPRSENSRRPEDEWLTNPDAEIDLTLGYEQASEEAARCMSCGLCFDCEQCFMYCNAGGFTHLQETRPGHYFAMALDLCEGCGKCIELCPCGYLESREPIA